MTAVLKCDGCGQLAGETKPVGWLQVRRFKEQEEDDDSRYGFLKNTADLEFVGHCCSVKCLANLALAQNDYEPLERGPG